MSFTSNRGGESSSSYPSQQCLEFTLSEIELATDNFDESRLLGSGGFAKVYKGTLTYDEEKPLAVAIKRLTPTPTPTSSDGAIGFWYEVAMLSKLRHPHLVSLIGYCSDRQEMILVYEYMRLGTLEHHLHKGGFPLSWVDRLKICLEVALGLQYLHSVTDTKSMVLHLDVKSSNILLASNWATKLSDFGLSKVRPAESAYVTDHVGGTLGYIDPHFQQNGKASRKIDVFAFGVVMLELLCGKKAYASIDGVLQFMRAWAQDSIKKGKLKQIIDPNLKGRISPKCLKKFAKLADSCLHSRPEQRPAMEKVVKDLESILALEEVAEKASIGATSAVDTSLKLLDRYIYTVGGEDCIPIHRFDFSTIVQATENFSEANTFLYTGHRSVYKGRLQNGQDTIITQYSVVEDGIFHACRNEVSLLGIIKHENIIRLLGYCIGETNVYFLYDFAFNANLGDLLADPMCNLLDLNKRYNIILGVAKGIAYIHHHAPIRIMHRDVKPTNILLDGNFIPRLSDFGRAMFVEESDWDVDAFIETSGYRAPEYILQQRLSTKADVFSFGVLILNIVTWWHRSLHLEIAAAGQTNTVLFYLYQVQRNWLEGRLSDIVDPRIDDDTILTTKLMEIGSLCVQRDPEVRPTMEEVVDMLVGNVSQTPYVLKMLERIRIREDPDDIGSLSVRVGSDSEQDLDWIFNDESSCVQVDSEPDSDWIFNDDYDTDAVGEFISDNQSDDDIGVM